MANPFRKIRIFFSETVGELQKSSWPTRKELRDSTLVILIAIIILGIFITLADFSVYNWVTLFTQMVRPDTGMIFLNT